MNALDVARAALMEVHYGGAGADDDHPVTCLDVRHLPDGAGALLWSPFIVDDAVANLTDQLPFATFTPGRWAVLLTDVARTEDRCPACWGRAFDCDHPRHGMSLGCLCGVCDSGTCPPIPARGSPGIWRWEP